MGKEIFKIYECPSVEIVEIKVEQGFAVSDINNGIESMPEQEW